MSAIFTICRGDEAYKPIWENYYKPFFDEMIVLIDNTPKGKDIYEKFNFITPLLVVKQSELLTRHNVLVYAEIDEFLIPLKGNLANYVAEFQSSHSKIRRATGRNVIQTEDDAPLDWTKPILSQRKYWVKDNFYSKIVMSKVPTRWFDGMIGIGKNKPIDENLILAHFKYADIPEYLKRGKERADYHGDEQLMLNLTKASQGAEEILEECKKV